MKRLTTALFLFTAVLFTPHVVAADSYWGIKTSLVDVDNSAFSSNALNVGIFIGVDVAEIGPNPLAIEADIGTTLVKGTGSVSSFDFDWGTQTTAIYAAMRTGNDDYFKVKFGAHHTVLTTEFSGGSPNSGSENGIAYGFGLKFGEYEVEYTVLKGEDSNDPDISMFSLGFHF